MHTNYYFVTSVSLCYYFSKGRNPLEIMRAAYGKGCCCNLSGSLPLRPTEGSNILAGRDIVRHLSCLRGNSNPGVFLWTIGRM